MSTPVLLHDAVRHAAKLYPDRPVIIDEQGVLTYAGLWQRANRLANALRTGRRLPRQARVGLLATNSAAIAEVYVACALAGCACVPINYRLTGREVAAILADADVRLLFVHPGLEAQAATAVEAGFAGEVVWLGQAYERLLADGHATYRPTEPQPASDIVLQMYTSGTTGSPKGAMLSHRNLVANSWTNLAERNVVEGDTYLVVTPLCQIGGTSRLLTAFLASATVRLLGRFDAGRVWRLLEQGEVTTTFLVPTMIRQLLDAAPPGLSPRPFRRLCYGGSPMPYELLAAAMQRLRCEFQQGYGLTESSPNLTTLRPEDHVLSGPPEAVARLGSVGRESVGVQVRVVDEHGADVAVGERGEIVARGANIMEGYWRRPEATAAAIRDGWLHTGDVGVLDERNFVFLVDRTTDMLISGGLNVYPREIELRLEQHPAVAEVAVVSRADARWGEVPVAFVALRAGASAEAVRHELERLCREQLAGYKQPKDYLFISALPRNAMGKVLKAELRARAGRQTTTSASN